MSRNQRAGSLAVLALVALPVLSACNTSPGAAATVGSQRISTGALEAQVNESLAGGKVQSQQGFTQVAFTRELLGHMIDVDLINAAAAAHHVSVTAQDIANQQKAFIQQAGGSEASLESQAAQGGVTAAQLPGFIRYAAVQQKLSTALVANATATPAQLDAEYKKDIDQFDQLHIAQIPVKSKALAHRILNKVRRHPKTFAAQAKKYSIDAKTKANGGDVGFVGRTAVLKALGGTANPGTFTIVHSSGAYDVVHVIARRTIPESAVTQQLKTSLFSAQAQTLLQKAIAAEATKLGVHVSPRYGRWDSATSAVVAVPDPVSSTG